MRAKVARIDRLLLFLLLAVTVLVAANPLRADGAPDLVWFDAAGQSLWRSDPADRPPADDAYRPWAVPAWHPVVPDMVIPFYGGGALDLNASRGKVIVLSFWTTWCGPCQEELPYLQQLFESTRNQAIEFVAVNVLESPQLALPWAEEIGLTMPVGIYDPDRHGALFADRLPTTVVIDRRGRIRGRWEAFDPGDPEKIDGMVRRLLGESTAPVRDDLLQLTGDPGPWSPDWVRETSGEIGGMVGAAGGFLASGPAVLDRYRVDGLLVSRTILPRAVSTLRAGESTASATPTALGFRAGGVELQRLQPGRVRPESWILDAAIFDVRSVDRDTTLVGRIDGLFLLDLREGSSEEIGDLREVSGLARVAAETGPSWAVLEAGRQVRLLDDRFEEVGRRPVSSTSWSLVECGTGGFGVASDRIVDAVCGRFEAGREPEVAFVDQDGRLRVVDRATGRIRLEARWDGLSSLAAIDPDGDGIDELLLAAGKRIALLRARSR